MIQVEFPGKPKCWRFALFLKAAENVSRMLLPFLSERVIVLLILSQRPQCLGCSGEEYKYLNRILLLEKIESNHPQFTH